MASDREPFLPQKIYSTYGPPISTKASPCHPRKFWLFHAVLVTLYSLTFILALRRKACLPVSEIDGLSIAYKPLRSHNLTGNPYAGLPNPSIDAAWDSLMVPLNLRITDIELSKANQDSTKLPGEGYLGWMGVFHELHCVRMLRQWNYKEYYYQNISTEEEKHLIPHIEHCLETLRQAAMCHADTSLITFKWDSKVAEPMFNASESIHSCVDWSTLTDSLASRIVGDEEVSQMVNPFMRISNEIEVN